MDTLRRLVGICALNVNESKRKHLAIGAVYQLELSMKANEGNRTILKG